MSDKPYTQFPPPIPAVLAGMIVCALSGAFVGLLVGLLIGWAA
jgi:hypothetical protein